jgi:tetratricopeptide (TPR) repeat protein
MVTIQDRLQHGVALHQKSQYDAAREVYNDVLSSDPNNADAIHLLGVLDMQAGENELALERLLRAVELQPQSVPILANLGAAQRRVGKLDDALSTYRRAIQLDPNHAECYHNMGVALRSIKRNQEAAECFRKAIQIKPNYVEAIRNLTAIEIEGGNWQQAMQSSEMAAKANPEDISAHMRLAECQMRMKQFPEAIQSFNSALKIDPQQLTALNGLGLAYKGVGDLERARQTLEKALEIDAKNFPALANLGTVYQGLKNYDKAIELYRKALELNADSAESHNNLGGALKEKGDMEQSRWHCQKAIELKPELSSARCNLAAISQLEGDFDTAIAGYETALQLQGDLSEGLLGIASAYAQMGQLKKARSYYSKALFHNPKNAEARLYRGIIGLLDGDLDNAWSDYEWRWEMPENNRRKIPGPRWDGSDLKGNTILIHAEQGLGDTLQFVRYGKKLKEEKNATVVLECQKALLPILSRVGWIDRLIAQGEPLPAFHCHCPMLSLPGSFGTTLESMPSDCPYLEADPDLCEKWSERFKGENDLKVGIAWQGNPDFKQDKFRSIPLKHFQSLMEIPNTKFFSLQKGFGTEQIKELPDPSLLTVFEGVDTDEGAFMDTAAILKQLDLFITSDSAIAHLAGALGIKTWLLLPFAPDWRWLLQGEKTGWYPSVRLFRQTKFAHWDEIFQTIHVELKKTVAQNR